MHCEDVIFVSAKQNAGFVFAGCYCGKISSYKHIANAMICPFVSFQILYDPMNAYANGPDVDGPKTFATFGSSFCNYG